MSERIGRVVVSTKSPLLSAGLIAALRSEGIVAGAPDEIDDPSAWVVDSTSARRAAKSGAAALVLTAEGETVGDAPSVGMHEDLEVLVQALAAGRAGAWQASSASDALLADLTDRELDIVATVAGGATNRMVADALGISPNTVRTHLQNIMAKVGVTNRRELAAVYLEGQPS